MSSTPPLNHTKLNLGCGLKPLPDHINVDIVAEVKPDVIHDLNRFPYPFADSSFTEICAYDVVEHVEDMAAFFLEIWRVGRPGAKVKITTPHFSCNNSFMDPTHRRHLSYFSWDYFTAGHPFNFYGSEGFKISQREIIFSPTLCNKLVHRLANRWPVAYESRWAWIFPAWFLTVDLTVCK